ncbi:hypothetical protein D3C77_724660 [compost metagenome]
MIIDCYFKEEVISGADVRHVNGFLFIPDGNLMEVFSSDSFADRPSVSIWRGS